VGKETKYNIINILSYQLYEIERLIKKDVERGDMIYNYFINENKCKLLDFYQLETYLTKTKIENLASLESMNNLCIRINNLWNDDLKKLECKKLENPFTIKEPLFNSWIDFYAIYISKIEFHYCITKEDKKELLLNTNKHYTLASINAKCIEIRNTLKSFYPSLRLKEDSKQYYIQYQNFKHLKFTPKIYPIYQYDEMSDIFNKHALDCKYIFENLNRKEQNTFKNHVIDNLIEVENIQIHEEFKKLLSNIIAYCRNNFNEPQKPTENNKTSTKSPSEGENNLTVSTIEDWLFEFKEQEILKEKHYKNLVTALDCYFEKGTFPVLENKIKVGRVNKKRFGWVLNRIFHAEGKGIEINLLRFAKNNISIFEDVNFDENNLQKSNLYKYFTTTTEQHRKH